MRDVDFLPAWYPRQRRIRAGLILVGFAAVIASLGVIVLLSLG